MQNFPRLFDDGALFIHILKWQNRMNTKAHQIGDKPATTVLVGKWYTHINERMHSDIRGSPMAVQVLPTHNLLTTTNHTGVVLLPNDKLLQP